MPKPPTGAKPSSDPGQAQTTTAPTVLLYAHYDVQPPLDESAWRTPPFELTEVAGRWYGRGTADCKGNIVAHLLALRALGDDVPVNLKLVVEGSEEQGTGGLEDFVPKNADLLRADAILVCDTGNAAVGRPAATVTLRGMVNVVVTVEALKSEVHSGMFGGPAPDALAALVAMLASLRDSRGSTTITGLDNTGTWTGAPYPPEQFRSDAGVLEGVSLLTGGSVSDMLWARPAITILGIDCPPVLGSTAAIVPRAAARLNLRIPPGTAPDRAYQALVDHLQAVAPWGVHVTVDLEAEGAPFKASVDGPAYAAMASAMEDAYETPMTTLGQGGSIPLCNVFAETYPECRADHDRGRGAGSAHPCSERECGSQRDRVDGPRRGPLPAAVRHGEEPVSPISLRRTSLVTTMVADRRRLLARLRRRDQTTWAAAALLTVMGTAIPMVLQSPTDLPTPLSTASASPSPASEAPSPTRTSRSPTPVDTSSAVTPPASPSATTAASLTPTGAPSQTSSELPTPDARQTSAAAPTQSPPPQRPATPPASSAGAVPLSSVLIAIAVLVASLVLLLLARKGEGQVAQPEAAPPSGGSEPATDVLVLLASAGEALIDSGFDIDDVDANLEALARAYGMADTEIIAMPTALLVSSRSGGQLRTRAVASGRHPLRLHQIEELDDIVRSARTGGIDPRTARDQILAMRSRPSPFGPSMQVVGQVLATVGLAVLLGSTWLGIVVAAALGGLTGALQLAGRRVPPRFQVLLTVAASFSVSLAGLPALADRTRFRRRVQPDRPARDTVARSTADHLGDRAVDRPDDLRGWTPGAGATQLVLLGLGILAAAALVGVPAFDLTATKPVLGVLGPWLAVGIFGIGIVMNRCARPSSLGWILLVLYVAYGGQVLGGLFFGGVLSAFVGAAAMTPVADLVARQPSRAAGDRQLHTGVLAPGPRRPRPRRRRGPAQR